LAFETTRTGSVTRPRAVNDALAEFAIAAAPVRRLPLAIGAVTRVDEIVAGFVSGNVDAVTVCRGRLAATFGLGITADDMVGVSATRLAFVVAFVIVVPAVLFAATFGEGMAADDIVGVCARPLEVAIFEIVVPAGLLA
jgi:hypothetical protein